MELYNWVKITHIIAGSIVFISMVNAFIYWLIINRQDNPTEKHQAINRIRSGTWMLIIPFGAMQLLTGFTMISIKHYGFDELWVKGAFISIILLFIFWFGFMQLLSKMQTELQLMIRNPLELPQHSNGLVSAHYALLVLCVTTLLSLIFFMATRIS